MLYPWDVLFNSIREQCRRYSQTSKPQVVQAGSLNSLVTREVFVLDAEMSLVMDGGVLLHSPGTDLPPGPLDGWGVFSLQVRKA